MPTSTSIERPKWLPQRTQGFHLNSAIASSTNIRTTSGRSLLVRSYASPGCPDHARYSSQQLQISRNIASKYLTLCWCPHIALSYPLFDAFERSITRIQTAGGNLNKVEVAMVYPSELVGRPNLLLHLSQSVTSLSFMHFGFPMRIDTKSILEIMGVFSETLESLNLYLEIPGIITGSPLEPAPPFAQKVCMSQLRRLALSCPWNEVLPWFLLPGQVEFPRLTYLSVWMLFPIPDSRDLLQSFLDEKCANTVEDLELPCCYCYIPAIDLSQFTLRSIIFKGKNAGQVSEADCKKIVDIVSTASFAARKLTVVVTDDGFKLPSSNKDLDHVEWLIGSNLSETDEFEDMVLSVYRACFS
ncbi:hypothetical protein Moror_14591 [Moniliophthora roreri MCA 2997]|uniref:Uncharacterized protein n=1 Tax=Moniliophthora roreri (strain MCA 2997) TaxID=1381753 RepID=V2YNK5_MONRO|nr:hypothetical protein Moror_14591 [Moniliophthora roreri MCA 2997]